MLFGKTRCPTCGAKNSKERMTCATCGAPLDMAAAAPKKAAPPEPGYATPPPVPRPAAPPETGKTRAAPERAFASGRTLFNSPAATENHEKAEITLTEAILTFQTAKKRLEIPLPSIKDFEVRINYYMVSSRPITGLVNVTYQNKEGNNKSLLFNLKRDGINLLQHYIYKQLAGNYMDTDATKVKKIYNLTGAMAKGLRDAGAEVMLAAPKQLEEKITGDYSLGVIAVASGPIRWLYVRSKDYDGVHYQNYYTTGSQPLETILGVLAERYYQYDPDVYFADYGVPDYNMPPGFPDMAIYLREADGRLAWTGMEPAHHIITSLNARPELRHPVFNERNITITSYPLYSCWIISMRGSILPDPNIWGCCQGIAEELLNSTISAK